MKTAGFPNFDGLVMLTLDRVILHTVVHHSWTSTYMPSLTEIEETFCGRTDVRMIEKVRMDGHLRSALLGRLCQRVDLIKSGNITETLKIQRHCYYRKCKK